MFHESTRIALVEPRRHQLDFLIVLDVVEDCLQPSGTAAECFNLLGHYKLWYLEVVCTETWVQLLHILDHNFLPSPLMHRTWQHNGPTLSGHSLELCQTRVVPLTCENHIHDSGAILSRAEAHTEVDSVR